MLVNYKICINLNFYASSDENEQNFVVKNQGDVSNSTLQRWVNAKAKFFKELYEVSVCVITKPWNYGTDGLAFARSRVHAFTRS